jgi:hypothetical protein
MSTEPIRITPRSAIADAELARIATLELPASHLPHRPQTPQFVERLIARLTEARAPSEPERVIVMDLVPVQARRR